MLLFYLNNQNTQQSRAIRNLYRSYPGEKRLQATSRFEANDDLYKSASTVIFAGMIRGEGLIYKQCKQDGKNFIFVDHAYISRGYNQKDPANEWMRITYNSFTWNRFQVESPNRWKQHFSQKYKLLPWNAREGKNILVLPPSEATKYLFPESISWTVNAMQQVSNRLNLPVRIREKPNQPIIDPDTNRVTGRLGFNHLSDIEDELLDARCVIAFNSAVTVQATMMGIPCVCGIESAAYPVSLSLDKLKYPPEPDRQAWLDQLVCHQYTAAEMKSGDVWDMLKKYGNIE